MKRFIPLFVILFLFLSSSFVLCEVITQPLNEKIKGTGVDELIPVNVIMKEQPDFLYLMNLVKGKEISERREIVIDYLKEIRDRSQKRILSYLKVMEKKGKVERVRSLWLGNAVCFKATKDVIDEVAKFSGIQSIDWDEERMLLIHSGRSIQTLPLGREIVWNVSLVEAPQVWGLGYTGANIIVSVIDTGVRYTHWDLADHIWTNPGEIPNNFIDDDGNGYVDDYYGYDFYNNDSNPMDDGGHGTHCAGSVAGDGTAGSQTGVAPDARVMSLKVLSGAGNGSESDVWEAIQYSIDNGAQVISMSLGWQHAWGPNRQQWRNMCNAALAGGIIMSVAAGNEGNQQGTYPIPDNVRTPGDVPPPWLHPDQTLTGGLSAVVTVGATNSSDVIANFSSRGPVTWESINPWFDYPYSPGMGLIEPDVCAPGVDIKSLDYSGDNLYASGWNGTSMATPHVAGAMALMLSKNSNITQAVIDSILEVTAVELGPAGKDNAYGSGRIDCYDAILATPNINQPDIYYVSNTVDDAGGNSNGILDPGETVDLIVTLQNSGLDATGVQAKLRESNVYVTVIDSEATFGNIPQAGTADNSSNPYVVAADPGTPEGEVVTFTLQITCAEGDTFYRDFDLTIGIPGVWYADHNIGNVTFTVTCQGICGFMDDNQTEGSGFRYPLGLTNWLFIGSVWVGNASSYVVNRDYSGEGSGDWTVTSSPDGKVRIGETIYSDQDAWAIYDDAGHPSSKDIQVRQDSWAWANPPYDDFVIMYYTLKNNGASSVNGLYVGQFMDMDIDVSSFDDNNVSSNAAKRFVYEWSNTHTEYVGIKLLEPTTAANLTGIHNPTYVYPSGYITDANKIQFLNGSLSVPNSGSSDDWSIQVSAGPFDLSPGEEQIVAFSILAGDNFNDIEENADTSQYLYDSLFGALPPVVYSSTHPDQNQWYNNSDPNYYWTKDLNIVGWYYILDQNPGTVPDSLTGIYITDSTVTLPGQPSGIHYFHIVSRNSAGKVGTIASHYKIMVDVTPPEPCTTLVATSKPFGDIELSWSVCNDQHSGTENYEIHRSTTPGDTGPAIDVATITSYTDPGTGLIYGTWYYYTVMPVDSVSNKENTGNNQAGAISDDVPPFPPVVSSPTHPSQVTWYRNNDPVFEWNIPQDTTGISGYYYLLDQNPSTYPDSSTGIWITDTTISFVDVTESISYFHIISRDGVGHLSTSATHYTIMVNGAPSIIVNDISGVVGGDIDISYTLSDALGDTLRTHCEYSTNSGGTWFNATVTGDTSGIIPSAYSGVITWNSFTDLPNAEYTTVRFKITPYDPLGAGTSDETSDFHLDNIIPEIPTLVLPSDSSIINDNTPTFVWTQVTKALSFGTNRFLRKGVFERSAISYTLQYTTDPGFLTGVVEITGIADTTYTLPSSIPDTIYYWRIEAVDEAVNHSGFQIPFMFTLDSQAPTVPTLIAPPNGAYINNSTPTFIWSHTLDDNGSYTLEYALDSGFSSGVVTLTGLSDTTYTVPAPLSDTTYYWHVKATDEANNESAFSTAWQFEVDTQAPAAPTLNTPVGGVWLTNTNVNFQWSTVTFTTGGGNNQPLGGGHTGGTRFSPVRYILEVDTNTSFASPLVVDTLTATSTSITLNEDFYYWRVRAYDLAGNQGSFSPYESFGVDATPPSTVNLISPANNVYLNNSTVNFIWNEASDNLSGVDHYVLQYALDSGFSTGLVETTLTDTVCTIILPDTIYYWHVKAVDVATNEGAFSTAWQFEVDTQAPAAPTLTTPVGGVWLTNTNVNFQWSTVTFTTGEGKTQPLGGGHTGGTRFSPVRYILEVDTNTSFTSPIVVDTLTATSTSITLNEDFYYWRVRAYDLAGNQGPYAAYESFGVDITAPVIDSTTIWPDTTYAGPFEIRTKVTDNLAGLDSVLLYYKRDEDPVWVVEVMHQSGDWFTDTIPTVSLPYDTVRYYIRAIDYATNESTDPTGAPASYYSFIANMVGVEESSEIPDKFDFKVNSIVKGKATFRFNIPERSKITLKIYDITGRVISEPLSGSHSSGIYQVTFKPKRQGIYFYRLESPYENTTGKLVIF